MLKEKIPLSCLGNIEYIRNIVRYGNIEERLFQCSRYYNFQCYYDSYQHNTNIILNCEKRRIGSLLYSSKTFR